MSIEDIEIKERLKRIETILDRLVTKTTVKEWYSTGDVAAILGKAEWTVREWCRKKRVKAQKQDQGRGNEGEWRISHAELERIQEKGLLPDPNVYRHPR